MLVVCMCVCRVCVYVHICIFQNCIVKAFNNSLLRQKFLEVKYYFILIFG